MGLFIGIGYEMGRYLARPKIMQSMKPEVAKIVKSDSILYTYDSLEVDFTVFNPTEKQCGKGAYQYTCADGSIINPKCPQRWFGRSRDLAPLIKYGQSYTFHIPQAPYLNGEWIARTTGKDSIMVKGKKVRVVRHIDLLIANPTVCNIQGKWKGFIIIKTKKP
jgi:hypothetical protein